MEHREIARGMQVLTSDGELLGTVDRPSNEGFMLRRMGDGDREETVPDMWVHRVDEHVHLNRTGAETVAGWKSLQFQTSSGERPGAVGETRPEETSGGGMGWLLWVAIAAIAILAILAFTGQLDFG
ncbi:MAG TPA: DUF2171 domain-containing protein [Allosphingosinicella sp.]|nr:DUF2171 domain-containing protein [Allosphingosinicella sp.]